MPGMDGLEASRIIKLGGRLKNIPKIVIVRAFGRENIRAQADAIGVEGYLLKPLNASLLYDTLMDLFGFVTDAERSQRRVVQEEQHDATGIRVLLVEDNEMNQQVASERLESAGAKASIANHGGEAIDASFFRVHHYLPKTLLLRPDPRDEARQLPMYSRLRFGQT